MARLIFIVFGLLVCQECSPRSITEEDSVVSVYTTQSTTNGVVHVDVYHQIANNIAERITSPIYRFFGFNRKNNTEATTKRSWDKVELLDEPEDATKTKVIQPVNNDINDKDVEELSAESLQKTDKKPEKISLFPNYLPAKIELNDTVNKIGDDDSFGFDDVDDESEGKQGPLGYVLELLGSAIQLLYGGIAAAFSASKAT